MANYPQQTHSDNDQARYDTLLVSMARGARCVKGKTHMPSKRQVTGLQRVGVEWVSNTLNFAELPADWAEIEASQHPEPWLDSCPHLHALRRMAIMADAGAVRLLLSLEGQDRAKEQQIIDRAGDKTADRAIKAAQSALAYLTVRPPQPPSATSHPPPPSESSDDEA